MLSSVIPTVQWPAVLTRTYPGHPVRWTGLSTQWGLNPRHLSESVWSQRQFVLAHLLSESAINILHVVFMVFCCRKLHHRHKAQCYLSCTAWGKWFTHQWLYICSFSELIQLIAVHDYIFYLPVLCLMLGTHQPTNADFSWQSGLRHSRC